LVGELLVDNPRWRRTGIKIRKMENALSNGIGDGAAADRSFLSKW